MKDIKDKKDLVLEEDGKEEVMLQKNVAMHGTRWHKLPPIDDIFSPFY